MGAGDDLTCRVLGTLDEMEAARADWQALDAHCADPMSYFQSYEWCHAWMRQFGAEHRPYVVTLWRGETLVALWPRMIVEAAGLRRLETLGTPHSQYCGALVRRDTGPREDIAEAFAEAERLSGCDVAIARAVLQGSALDGLLGEGGDLSGPDNVASILDLSMYGSSDAYAAQLGKLQRRNRNRRRNHLARLGDLHFEMIWPGHPDFPVLVHQACGWKRRWLSETNRYSAGFAMAGYEDMLAAVPGDGVALEGACLSVLRAGERVVAIELGFIRQRHYYAYVGGFDWDLRELSPGKVQMEMTVGWLIDHGVGAYDLLINPADYKASWTNKTVPVAMRAEALTWKGQLYASAWLPTVRPALKRLHGQMPMMTERAVMTLRPAACLLLFV